MGTLTTSCSFSFSVPVWNRTRRNSSCLLCRVRRQTSCSFSFKSKRKRTTRVDYFNFYRFKCFSSVHNDSNNGDEEESSAEPSTSSATTTTPPDEPTAGDKTTPPSSRPPTISPVGPAYNSFQLVEVTGNKYNLFMVEEPNSEGPDPRGGPRVSFGLLRKEVSEPGPTTLWQYVIALLLFLLTIGSSVELGIASQINRLPPDVVKYFTDPNAIEPPDMELLFPFVESALPLAYGVLGVLLFHEVGHFLAAFPKKVKLSIPYFIPNITLGSFGAITQFKSILPDRSTEVDISIAGPVAGAALSFSMFAVGLLLSSNPGAAGDLVQVPSMLFQGSLLLGLITRATLGYAAMHAATVSIHPLVIAGWCGLTTSAFNMLPVGCLDGGRAVQGAFGKNALIGFGLTTYTLLGLGVLGGPLSLPWGLYVLICQRTPEKPCLNDVTEVGTWRKILVSVCIFLVGLTLLPVWDELAEELGIGLVTTF
ncbi:hypothetical protein ACJW30_09G131700 [Castanea mollissima]